MSLKKAKTLPQIALACDPAPLRTEDLAFFVDTAEARDPVSNRRQELTQRLAIPDVPTKVLLVGHKGCGKSTELTKFADETKGRFHTVTLDLKREATLTEVTIEKLLVLVVERALAGAADLAADLGAATLEAVYAWFSETFKESDIERSAGLEAGAKAGAEQSLLQKLIGLTAWLKADIRAGSRVLNRTISRETRRLSELGDLCGLVIKELQLALSRSQRELLVVVEDLDKASIMDATRLFFDEPGPLADLPCKAVYTFPIFLQCSPRIADLDPRFHRITLPMIDVYDPQGPGRAAVREIVHRRIETALIEEKALDLAIEKTGGALRDLFAVLDIAALPAQQAFASKKRSRPQIEEGDVRYALHRYGSDILAGVTVELLPEAFRDITVDDLYARLREYGAKPIRNARLDRINQALIQAHALMEYDGERWYRVHPLILEHVEPR